MICASKINYEVFNESSLILFALFSLKEILARSADSNSTPV